MKGDVDTKWVNHPPISWGLIPIIALKPPQCPLYSGSYKNDSNEARVKSWFFEESHGPRSRATDISCPVQAALIPSPHPRSWSAGSLMLAEDITCSVGETRNGQNKDGVRG
jgi:hypothetical protein